MNRWVFNGGVQTNRSDLTLTHDDDAFWPDADINIVPSQAEATMAGATGSTAGHVPLDCGYDSDGQTQRLISAFGINRKVVQWSGTGAPSGWTYSEVTLENSDESSTTTDLFQADPDRLTATFDDEAANTLNMADFAIFPKAGRYVHGVGVFACVLSEWSTLNTRWEGRRFGVLVLTESQIDDLMAGSLENMADALVYVSKDVTSTGDPYEDGGSLLELLQNFCVTINPLDDGDKTKLGVVRVRLPGWPRITALRRRPRDREADSREREHGCVGVVGCVRAGVQRRHVV